METTMAKVTIYSKKECHLCEIAKEKLLHIQNEIPFSIEEIDIEKDKTLFERYKYLIPVIEIDGKTIFTYRVDENELKKLLLSNSRF
jgi:glutaredoxin